MSTRLLFSFFCLSIVLVVLLGMPSKKIVVERPTVAAVVTALPEEPKKPEEIKLVFVGDIMLSRKIGKLLHERDDYAFPFASTTELIRSADIAFANLENPISTGGILSGSIYSFRAKPDTVESLNYAGFDVVSIANNHIWDYGKQAFLDTLSNLSGNGIIAVGGGENYPQAHAPKIIAIEKENWSKPTRIAFLAYTNLISSFLGHASSTPAVARFNDAILQADIGLAKELADVIIVSFHWGEEYETTHNREQERVAKLAIDAGANLIVGHHPHVVQEVEEYNGAYILYSLGNFVFDQNFSEDTGKGLLVEVTLKDGVIAEVVKKDVAFSADDFHPYFVE